MNTEKIMSDVKVEITYCNEWNYLPEASSLAAAIEGRYGIKSLITKGSGGIFTVEINDKLAYNNRDEGGRFPTKEEIFSKLEVFIKPLPENERKQAQDQGEQSAPSCEWSPDKK